jgi:predicted Zn finger-like uncharacterized protein
MIIQCPYCNTRFQLDESRLTGAHPMLKCSRCRHIFPGPSPATTAAPPKPTPPPAAVAPPPKPPIPAENLSFTFSPAEAKEAPKREPDLTIDEPEPEFQLGTDADEVHEDLTLPDPEPAPEPAKAPPPSTRLSSPAAPRRPAPPPDDRGADVFVDEFQEQIDEQLHSEFDEPFEEQEEEPPMPRGISVRPVVIFLGLVVAAYAVVAWTLRANPAVADSLFQKLPFISSLTEDRLLNRKIVLSDVTGGYQRIKDGQNVFVITGRALNNAPVTVRNVQILGRLFNSEGTQLDEKAIYCGNVISLKILKSLTQREVSVLQDLKPPKRFGIAPGEETIFVIVFMQPPSGVTEFSGQVVAAQRQA